VAPAASRIAAVTMAPYMPYMPTARRRPRFFLVSPRWMLPPAAMPDMTIPRTRPPGLSRANHRTGVSADQKSVPGRLVSARAGS
jgi:hypothetical protein